MYNCDTCVFWEIGFCTRYKKETNEDNFCDSWEDENGESPLGEDC